MTIDPDAMQRILLDCQAFLDTAPEWSDGDETRDTAQASVTRGLAMLRDRGVDTEPTDPHAIARLATTVADAANDACDALTTSGDILGPSLTCREAEGVADLLRALGRSDDADTFIRCHAGGDDDSTDEHHDQYLAIVNHDSERREAQEAEAAAGKTCAWGSFTEFADCGGPVKRITTRGIFDGSAIALNACDVHTDAIEAQGVPAWLRIELGR